jgi:homoserine O-succinyltransferase
MALLLERRRATRAGDDVSRAGVVQIGLLNNMPDAALEATERQFCELLDAAAGKIPVRLRLFELPEVPRGEAARRQMCGRYADLGALWNGRVDGLIVTGTEPRAADLKAEPYWGALARVVDWAQDGAVSSVWSCLAAHAAVLHMDGVRRHALPEKRFGVFEAANESGDAIVRGTAPRLRIPHSRCNDLPEAPLAACGYRILTASDDAGVDMFAKEGNGLFLFFQGHPEYDAATLLREYRRDIGRFLRGERETYPGMPAGYFEPAAAALLASFRERALVDRHDELLAFFPMSALEAGVTNCWRAAAVAIYRNWLSHLATARAAREASAPRAPRPWRPRAAISAFRMLASRPAG